MNAPGPCALCGRDPAAGFATINDRRYCHGDGDPEPTCYMRGQWSPHSVNSFSGKTPPPLGTGARRAVHHFGVALSELGGDTSQSASTQSEKTYTPLSEQPAPPGGTLAMLRTLRLAEFWEAVERYVLLQRDDGPGAA